MKSIRTLLTLRLLVGGTLLLGAAGIALQWQVRHALTTEFDATLRATGQSLASLTEQKHGTASLEFAGENMPQFALSNGPEVFLMTTADGLEIQRSPSLGTATLPQRTRSPDLSDVFDTTLPDGRAFRCAELRFTPHVEDDDKQENDPPILQALLIVGRERAPLDQTLAALRTSLLVVGMGTLALLAALVRWGVAGGLAPLARLGKSVAAVDAASLSTRFPASELPEELRPISSRLNDLLARLESAFARERRFTATVAHELRTPLAELRALAEVNLSTPATEAEHAESWRDTLATTLRIESLALRLLELTRAEDSARSLNFQRVPLAEAIAMAWRPWVAHAAERHVDLIMAVSADVELQTDPAMLGVILGNLCANAAEHAAGPLHITAGLGDETVAIHFKNLAGNLDAADLPHLFERFWCKDPSRTETRHHGLGLALAAEFTVLLGGTLTAEIDSDGELDFAIRLPSALISDPERAKWRA